MDQNSLHVCVPPIARHADWAAARAHAGDENEKQSVLEGSGQRKKDPMSINTNSHIFMTYMFGMSCAAKAVRDSRAIERA